MTADGFKLALDVIETTQVGFAALIDTNPRTVRRWAGGKAAVPRVVSLLLYEMIIHGRTAADLGPFAEDLADLTAE